MHKKDFAGWNTLKQNLDNRQNASVPTIEEREIWWCSIGINVGDEEDGHNALYNRPVLVVRKFNTRIFWGVAMTTQRSFLFSSAFKFLQKSTKAAVCLVAICTLIIGY